MDENEQINNNINYSQQTYQNKKKSNMKFWLILVILIVMIVVGIVGIGYIYYKKPTQIYKRMIASAFDSVAEQALEEDFETYKGSIKLDVDIETEEDIVNEEILKLINDLEIEIGAQISKVDKNIVVDLKSEYDNEDLLNLQLFAGAENEETYLYAKDIYDKYLKVETEDTDYSDLKDVFETEKMSFGKEVNLKKAIKVMKKEYMKIIKSEYCSSEKSVININDKDVKATKNTIKMTLQQMVDEIITANNNLKENETFLNLFEEQYRDELIDNIENYRQELEEMIEGYEETIIQVNMYTTGLTQKVAKIDIQILNETDDNVLAIVIKKLEDGKCSFEITSEDVSVMNGTVVSTENGDNNGSIKIETEIEKVGKFNFNIEYNKEYNISIDKVDKDNCVDTEEMTEEQQQELLQNIQDSKIYELVIKILGNIQTLDNGISTTNTQDNEASDEIVEAEGNTETTIDDNTSSTDSASSSSIQDNQIIDYDDKLLITFGIPNGYQAERISKNYQVLNKDDVSISITTSYDTEDEYYDLIEDSREYYTNQSYYKNVILSDKETITVGGNKFNKVTLKYDYVYSDNSLLTITNGYIWAKISDDEIIEIKIEEFDKMTQDEIKELLTITVKDN